MHKKSVHDLHDLTTAATAQDPPRFFGVADVGRLWDVIAAIAMPYWGVLIIWVNPSFHGNRSWDNKPMSPGAGC